MNKEQMKDSILQSFNFRHATKVFDPEKKISEDDFSFILETGRLSPSSLGLEPWKFVVLQNPEIREEILPVAWGAQGQLPTASHFVLILTRTGNELKYDAPYVENHFRDIKKFPEELIVRLKESLHGFQRDQFKLLENERALNDWVAKQAYIPLTNMMTAAAQIGIDSCPIEGFDPEKVNAILEKHNLLEDGKLTLSVMAAFGYRAKEPHPKTRNSLKNIVQWV